MTSGGAVRRAADNSGPDSTAITAALWRAAHLRLDAPPYIVADDIGLRLVQNTDVLVAYLGSEIASGPDDWLRHPYMKEDFRRWRATMVARARLVDDIVVERATHGCGQYVVLGAGLDSFVFRHPNLVWTLRVFEVDEPGTQAWKRRRLREAGMVQPETLYFVPVDFECQSWVQEMVAAGFDQTRSSVVSSLRVTQYLSHEAIRAMLRDVARLALGTVFVCGFVLPAHNIDPSERDMRAKTEERAATRGHRWRSFFSPGSIRLLAEEAGFPQTSVVTAEQLASRYFAGRGDGLRPSSSEAFLIAATKPA